MTTHTDHRFSVTLKTKDLAIVGCLRALAKYSQKHGNNQIPWGGTKDDDWRTSENQATFRFSEPTYRAGFIMEVERLLPSGLWAVVSQSDSDPATPQRKT